MLKSRPLFCRVITSGVTVQPDGESLLEAGVTLASSKVINSILFSGGGISLRHVHKIRHTRFGKTEKCGAQVKCF